MTSLQTIQDFEQAATSAHPGAGREAREDVTHLEVLALFIVTGHRMKAETFNKMGLARDFTRADGVVFRGRYDIAAACQAEADYLEISREASAIVGEEIQRLLEGGA